MTFLAGTGTQLGHDYTVFATTAGKVKFDHARRDKKRVRVETATPEAPAAAEA
jgi:ribosomal protein L27